MNSGVLVSPWILQMSESEKWQMMRMMPSVGGSDSQKATLEKHLLLTRLSLLTLNNHFTHWPLVMAQKCDSQYGHILLAIILLDLSSPDGFFS